MSGKPKFKAGDIIRFKDSKAPNAFLFEDELENLEIMNIAGTTFNGEYFLYTVYNSDKSAYWTVREDEIELMTTKETLTKKEMELKDIDKSVLADANKEVLEEIRESEKAEAKRILRELYDKKNALESEKAEIEAMLNEVLKNLSKVKSKKK